MLQQSGIVDKSCEVYGNQPRLYIYRDLAYTGSFGVIGLYQHLGGCYALPTNKHQFNTALSLVRIVVKHAFGHTSTQ
jgi:hypothetical protein